jgi:hypothetical protein
MAPIALPSALTPRSLSSLRPLRTRSLSHLSTTVLNWLHKRQTFDTIIPTTYGSINSGPSPGTIVGIVLGSVGGFLLLLWLLYTCLNFGTITSSDSSYTESVVVTDRRKSTHGSTRTRSRRPSETVEIRRERSPIRRERSPIRIVREPVVERVIVEEARETRRPPPPRDRSESMESDEVVVIEEHDPPPKRKKSVREERVVREEVRRESGYRTVDPLAYGGTVGGRKDSRRGGR